MTLFTAHKVMIGTAIAFSAGFAIREVAVFASSGGGAALALGAVSAAAVILLALYLRWLSRTKGRSLEGAASRRSLERDN